MSSQARLLVTNKLLRALVPETYVDVAPHLRRRSLRAKQVLYEPDQPITDVYFPENAVIALVTVMPNGATIQTAMVGNEGASWISATAGGDSLPCETIVVIGGEALTLDVHAFDALIRGNRQVDAVLTRYSHALLIHSLRTTSCTGLHSLEQRCAAWILTTLDRVQEDGFDMTHEFLAALLGANRPSISMVMERFRKSGILRSLRGHLVIGDRERLMAVTCGCYEVVKRAYAQATRSAV